MTTTIRALFAVAAVALALTWGALRRYNAQLEQRAASAQAAASAEGGAP